MSEQTTGYPGASRGEYLGAGDRAALAASRISAAAAGLRHRREASEKALFNKGAGGVARLGQEVATVAAHTTVKEGTRLVVGNLSPRSKPIAERDLAAFAPEGTPSTIEALRAVVLHEGSDTAWGVVTKRTGDSFELGLVELGLGAKNPDYTGLTGKTVAHAKGLRLSDESQPYRVPDVHSVESAGIRASFQDGQVAVEPFSDKAAGVTVLTEMDLHEGIAGVNELAATMANNPMMWSLGRTDHSPIPGMV